jgi:two-component system, NarL family, response regulator DevR
LCRNRLLGESIARILTHRAEFEVVPGPTQGSASGEEVTESGAEVLVLDSLDFLDEHGTSVHSKSEARLSPRCVLIAMEDDHKRFLTAVRRGARGYVLQDASAVDVMSAIRAVAEGQSVCPSHYTQVLFDFVAVRAEEMPNSRRRELWGLTRREQQLIPLIGRGLSNKEIANQLNLSDQTVKNHIHRILRKVGVSDRLSVFETCQNSPSSAY